MDYRTATPVGQGAMGRVYRVWDPEGERWVALKYLRTDDPDWVRRMKREARVQGRLEHPNIARVHEVGEHEGRTYIAMDYIDGRPLDALMDELPLEAGVALLADCADALHTAHTAGLIHRDVKPGNILVAETDDGTLHPYLLDFGLVLSLGDETLTAAGDMVAIHYDASAARSDLARIRAALADNPSVAFAVRRVRCGWGEWSLVQATLNTLATAIEAFPRATHFYLVSGDCKPIKSAEYMHDRLGAEDADLIESLDYFDSDWIRTGFREERLIYRHWFNERSQRRAFYAMFEIQKRLGLTRAIPPDLQVMIGSQWWCLRRATVEAILDFARRRRDVMRFFRTTWIPDETFFQTLVRHLVPAPQIRGKTPTFLMFTDYGMPVTFYNDHFDLLVGQDHLFARKISPEAETLRRRLDALFVARGATFKISDEGRNLYRFLTGRGRVGRRFAPRFWEREATLGRDRELLVVTCKKWHVAKRLLEHVRKVCDIPALEYIFDEDSAPMPDLGGIETGCAKRARHRRALLRMLFDRHGTDRMIICLDPANLDLLRDFASDSCRTRILDIRCSFSDDYLLGHARRVGLAGALTGTEVLDRLLPAIRDDFAHEADRISDAGLAEVHRLDDSASTAANARALARFLSLDEPSAQQVAEAPHLFAD